MILLKIFNASSLQVGVMVDAVTIAVLLDVPSHMVVADTMIMMTDRERGIEDVRHPFLAINLTVLTYNRGPS